MKFLKSFLPWKGDKVKEVFRKIALLVSILVFVTCSLILIRVLIIDPKENDDLNDDIRSIYHDEFSDNASNSGAAEESKQEKLRRLAEINSDIKGWIFIPDTFIDYPVLQSPQSDPEFYLYRGYNKVYSKYGSIFIDSVCNLGTESKNILLHGHHMNDKRMFGHILKYSDLEFYKAHPDITFDTIYEEAKWKVISIFKTNTRNDQGEIFNYLISGFKNDSQFLNYVYQVRERSLIDMPVDVYKSDYLLTLSTCSYEFKDFRTVVVARKVRPGESADVDISQAKINEEPYMPSCWYSKYGGTQPKLTTFEDQLSKGKIRWYKNTV